MKSLVMLITLILFSSIAVAQEGITLVTPQSTPCYGVAEFVINITDPAFANPFTDSEVMGTFTAGKDILNVNGFADSQDGSVFRLRFSPEKANTTYDYHITFTSVSNKKEFSGKLRSKAAAGKGPVIVDPANPKHFIYASTGEPFFHLGYTAYGLVDPANDDRQVEATIRYCKENGFNKIRFLLSGYPRDFDNRTSSDVEHGVPADPWKSLNYGSMPGRVNPLPTWIGSAHKYDFTRFNVSFWQRVDRAVRLMNENGIIATCIFQIEKQDLPKELGTLTENEYRLYKYGVARLAAFSNVWWDLGNEHNEFRKPAWGNTMGDFVKANDPYDRLASAHAYAEFFYNDSKWADFIITQQYGDLDSVHNWTLKFNSVPKPYVNEEYGYEGITDKPVGHGMNRAWVRKCHWAIAMAGGYATYGDWSDGVSYFYMGFPGKGQAVTDLKNLRSFFESTEFNMLRPADNLTSNGYCMSVPGRVYVFYLPDGGSSSVDLSEAGKGQATGNWFDPVSGKWSEAISIQKGKASIKAPSEGKDWVFLVSPGK
jgi:hypothetical protein